MKPTGAPQSTHSRDLGDTVSFDLAVWFEAA
jgi:hypothetical protein